MLALPDYSLEFIIETDASVKGLGAILSQIHNKESKVIAYASRTLQKCEQNDKNNSSKKLELLAVKWTVCDVFKPYILGGTCTILTDNNPLTYIYTQKDIPAIEMRWMSALASFDIKLRYRSGKTNINADVLSRKDEMLNECIHNIKEEVCIRIRCNYMSEERD